MSESRSPCPFSGKAVCEAAIARWIRELFENWHVTRAVIDVDAGGAPVSANVEMFVDDRGVDLDCMDVAEPIPELKGIPWGEQSVKITVEVVENPT